LILLKLAAHRIQKQSLTRVGNFAWVDSNDISVSIFRNPKNSVKPVTTLLQTWKVNSDLVFVHVIDFLHNSFPPPGVILFCTDQLLIPLQQFIFPMIRSNPNENYVLRSTQSPPFFHYCTDSSSLTISAYITHITLQQCY
jgi:hypothetical protein